MAGKGGAVAWKMLATLSAVTAGVAARKTLSGVYRKTTGRPPPANPEAPSTSWQEALGWAALSGATIGVARMLATRKAAAFYRKSTGHLPSGLEEVS